MSTPIYPPLLMFDVQKTIASGTKAQFNEFKLKNPFRTGTMVSEIRVAMETNNGGTLSNAAGPGDIWVKVAMGRVPLTSEFVPAWLLGKKVCDLQDEIATNLVGSADAAVFVWKFPKPMYVPPGEGFTASVWLNSTDLALPLTNNPNVAINIFGVCTDKEPKVSNVPFVSAFVGAKNVGGANSSDQSYERDLMNPFGVPMFVERFVGRLAVINAGAGNVSTWDSYNLNEGDQAAATGCLVRAVSSIGGQLVRDQTPFDNIFYGPERSWPVHTWVPPKTFFKFYFTENWSALSANNHYRPEVSIVGYRPVELMR